MDPTELPTTFSHTQLLLMLFSILAGVVAIVGFILWAAKHAYEERQRLRCPIGSRMATVLFALAPDGRRTDVLRCSSLFEGMSSIDCGKPCLHATGTEPVALHLPAAGKASRGWRPTPAHPAVSR